VAIRAGARKTRIQIGSYRNGVEIPRKSALGISARGSDAAKRLNLSVILPRGFHPFPSRTRKLSPAGPIVLHAKVCGRVGRCRH
jgi:hypothetical protein